MRRGDGEWLRQLMREALLLRSRFIEILEKEQVKNKKLILLCYIDHKKAENLFLLANKRLVNFNALLPAEFKKNCQTVRMIRAGGSMVDVRWDIDGNRFLNPGEVLIGYRE